MLSGAEAPYGSTSVATAEGEARASDFSVDDYGYGPRGPFQILEPAYPAPKWLNRYVDLKQALRECQTLCTLKGRPYRVMSWHREGAGNKGGVPCAQCKPTPGGSRFPRHVNAMGEVAKPVAEFRPDGQRLIFDNNGNARLVGKPNYVVSRNPFPPLYNPRPATQRYMEAVLTGQALADRIQKRIYICSSFGADCPTTKGVPVVYVDPGGLARRHPKDAQGTVIVNPVSPGYFQELVAESRGRTLLGQGA